jgi:hypothetical protein
MMRRLGLQTGQHPSDASFLREIDDGFRLTPMAAAG